MRISFAPATEADAGAIVALHETIAAHRRRAFVGARPWRMPKLATVVSMLRDPRSLIVVGRADQAIVASFRLDLDKGFCGIAPFTEVPRFVYLIEMGVLPDRQRSGIGRACLAFAEQSARAHGASAVRLDTNDDVVDAGRFYLACGYREVLHHARTRYFERML